MARTGTKASRTPAPSGTFKREATQVAGLPTPNASMSSSDGTFSPKREELDEKLSNSIEGSAPALPFSYDGLPPQSVEPVERKPIIPNDPIDLEAEDAQRLRSPSPSAPSSFSNNSFRQPTMPPRGLTIASRPSKAASMAPSIAHSMAAIPNIGEGGLQKVGTEVNLLVDAIEALRQLGIKELDTLLPELVLVGDQSAGKSSLMGAIAEINLPKQKGMCTRCPANIKTSPSETWRCTVSLQDNYFYSPDSRSHRPKSTKSQPFPPWKPCEVQDRSIRPFKTIENKVELESVLKWAQVALLNPNRDYRLFIPGSGAIAEQGLQSGHKNDADFSPNIVMIEISGPRLPALSFYDLPGLFQNSANIDEEYLVKVFDNLTEKYIKKNNALIIMATTMQNDPELSKTASIITKFHARDRTVGVLTMADRLQEGSTHETYDAMLRGDKEKHWLKKGYFVTKQPGSDFMLHPNKDYHCQAREEESDFFDHNARWTGEWVAHRDKCGTEAIQNYLSVEFARMIAASMPDIEKKIQAQTEKVEHELRELPEVPNHNVQHVVRQCLQEFSNTVRGLLQGGPNSNDFLSQWGQLSHDFGEVIQGGMKPMFTFMDPSDRIMPEVINLDDDSDDDGTISRASSVRKHPNNDLGFHTPPNKRPRNEMAIPASRGNSTTPSVNGAQSAPLKREVDESPSKNANRPMAHPKIFNRRKTAFDEWAKAGRSFMSIADIRATIQRHKRPGHPDNVSDAAREEICLESVKKWIEPLQRLGDRAFAMLQDALLNALKQTLGGYKQTELFRQSKHHIVAFLREHFVAQQEYLASLYDLENYKLFTINDDAFARYKAEELQLLQTRRRERRVICHYEKVTRKSWKDLDEDVQASWKKKIGDAQLGPDLFAREIDTAAYVRGYYRTAGFRFADNACQNIQGMLFRMINQKIMGLLEEKLELNEGDGEAKCRLLMIENPGEAQKRKQLQDDKAKLIQAAERLAKLVKDLGIALEKGDDDVEMEDQEEERYGANDDPSFSHRYSQPRASTEPEDD